MDYVVMVDAGHDVWLPFTVKAESESYAIKKVVKYAREEKYVNAVKGICYPIYFDDRKICEVPN